MGTGVPVVSGVVVGEPDVGPSTMSGSSVGDSCGVVVRSGVASGVMVTVTSKPGVTVGVKITTGLVGLPSSTIVVDMGVGTTGEVGLVKASGLGGLNVEMGIDRALEMAVTVDVEVSRGSSVAMGTATGKTMTSDKNGATGVGVGVGSEPPQATVIARSSNRGIPNVLIDAPGLACYLYSDTGYERVKPVLRLIRRTDPRSGLFSFQLYTSVTPDRG